MWIKIKKISFPIHNRNNIFILIVYDNTIFFFVFFSFFKLKVFIFKLRIWWKNFTIFYLIICDIIKFIFPTKKINVLLIWQKIQFIWVFSIPGKDSAYLEKIMLIRLKITRIDMLLLFLITMNFLWITFLYRLTVRHNCLL